MVFECNAVQQPWAGEDRDSYRPSLWRTVSECLCGIQMLVNPGRLKSSCKKSVRWFGPKQRGFFSNNFPPPKALDRVRTIIVSLCSLLGRIMEPAVFFSLLVAWFVVSG